MEGITMTSSNQHLKEKETSLATWESSANEYNSKEMYDLPFNEVVKNIKRGKTLLEIYQSCRNWWDHDIDPTELHHAHVLKKRVASNLSILESRYRHEKKKHD
jgi:hypothetical protein